MNDREKLIELLDIIIQPGTKTLGDIADHFIANGVTVQEWISVNDRLPENICPVLVVLEGMSTAFNGWYHDGKWWTVGAGTRPFKQKVTHWMPLPTPPKGENK